MGYIPRVDETLVQGSGVVISPFVLAVDPDFFGQFHGWAEVVLVKGELIGVQVVDQSYQGRVVDTVIAEQLSWVSSVFLLYVGIVVLFVRPAAGKANRGFSVGEVPYEVVVEELGAVVAVEPAQLERQVPLNFHYLLQHGHPVYISIIVRLQTKSPSKEVPQCATVSASMNPGPSISKRPSV